MEKKIWTECICREGNKAWFVAGNFNALFASEDDMQSWQLVTELPDFDFDAEFGVIKCVKCGEELFCFPSAATTEGIWVYHVKTGELTKIPVEKPASYWWLSIADCWQYDGKLYAISVDLKQIIVVDICKKQVTAYIGICEEPNERVARSVVVGQFLYIVGSKRRVLYRYDMKNGSLEEYAIPKVRIDINGIAFDGRDFWLAGYGREIYRWNQETNHTEVFGDLPADFGLYDFYAKSKELVDCSSVSFSFLGIGRIFVAEKYLWFVPWQGNQLLYMDRNTQEIKSLDIPEEGENRASLKRERKGKFSVLYVKEDRYLWLYSVKNRNILEIDMDELTWEYREICVKDEEIAMLAKRHSMGGGIMKEQKIFTLKEFCQEIVLKG